MVKSTAALIKSIVLSKPDGMSIEQLNDEFEKIVGEGIPYRRLGFCCLQNLLNEINGLRTMLNAAGERILTATGPKIKHVETLIEHQKREYFKQSHRTYKRFTPYSDNSRKSNGRKSTDHSWRNNTTSFNSSQNSSNGSQRNQSRSFEEGNFHNPAIIELDSDEELDTVFEPIVFGRQLIGDDFFLQLAIRNLNQPIWRSGKNMALHCGLCKSGQSIKDCSKALKRINGVSNRLVIMLGAVDIYSGASAEDMIRDMTELLNILRDRFSFSNSAVTLCTIPPLANMSILSHYSKVSTLYVFNNWIKSLNGQQRNFANSEYQIIDLYKLFAKKNYATNFDWFQYEARMVSGCRYPYVLWNKNGRRRAIEAIQNI